jgi:uncharacterized membrane protein YfcA
MPQFATISDPYLFWTLAVVCGMFVGVAKSGIPGVGILAVPLMALVFPAGLSTGILLPMLVVGDIFAVSYYKRHAVWTYVLRCLPWGAAGIVAGFFILKHCQFSEENLKHIIGSIVLAVLAGGWWVKRKGDGLSIPEKWWFAATLGLIGGFATMAANAAGPVWMVYFIAMSLPKNEFLGTGAWTFLILNTFKLPFSYALGYINADSLRFDAMMIPAIVAGTLLGIFAAKRIPQKAFDLLVKFLAAAAAVNLLLR